MEGKQGPLVAKFATVVRKEAVRHVSSLALYLGLPSAVAPSGKKKRYKSIIDGTRVGRCM